MATEDKNSTRLEEEKTDTATNSAMASDIDEKIERGASTPEIDIEANPIENTDLKNATTNHSETPASAPRSKLQNALIMISICMAVFLAAIDSVIITTALPTIAASFNASGSGFAWIGSAYFIASATSMPFWGQTSEIFGRKQIFLTANVVFMVGSLIAALAKNLNMLIGGRVVQGLGGGGLLVLGNLLVTDLFSMRERATYLALIGATWCFASSIGPIIGGLFAQKAGWRWCFWFNLPCDGLSLVIIILFLKVHNPQTPLVAGLKAMDWAGALAIASATVLFLLGLEFGGVTFPWSSATVICLIVFGVFTYGLFFFIELKIPSRPIVPLRMFATRSNLCNVALNMCHSFCYVGASFYLPLYYQTGLGYTPILSGVLYLFIAIPAAFVIIGTGTFITKTGNYSLPILIAVPIMLLSIGLFITFQPHINMTRIAIYSILFAIGMSPLFQAPTVALQAHLSIKDVAMGTSTFSFMRQLSGGISVAVGQVIFQSVMHKRLNTLLAAGLDPALAASIAGGNAIELTFLIDKLNEIQKLVVRTTVTEALDKMWIFYTALAGVAFLAAWGIENRELSKKYVEYKTGLKALEPKKVLKRVVSSGSKGKEEV